MKKCIIISWLLVVATIAYLTVVLGKITTYIDEFKKEDPYMQRYSKITPTPTPTPKTWKGEASYYSREGCLGCHPEMIMANGEPLDDSKLTVAFNHAPLGSMLVLENLSNGLKVIAEVTDTGGFHRYNRIIDVSLAVKKELKMKDLEQLKITLKE